MPTVIYFTETTKLHTTLKLTKICMTSSFQLADNFLIEQIRE